MTSNNTIICECVVGHVRCEFNPLPYLPGEGECDDPLLFYLLNLCLSHITDCEMLSANSQLVRFKQTVAWIGLD